MSAYIIDTETTGLVDPVPVEVAWLRIGELMIVSDSFDRRYRPGKPISFGAMATHHILESDLDECPPFSNFSLPSDCHFLIGHNIDFDWAAIGKPDVRRICTLALSRMLWPEADSHNLSALVYFLTDPTEHYAVREELIEHAHSAYGDCRTIHSSLLVPIIKKLGMTFPIDWELLWNHSEDARIPTTMPWGKHKGMAIKDVPSDYLRWLRREPGIDPYLLRAFDGR